MPGVVLEGVTKVYPDGTEAVSGLDLEVPDGSLCVLLGPSGCGKTTVLRLVAGLERLTEGTIWIGDRDVSDDAPKDRDVAMVFQSYALYPHLTVYDNIAFGLQLRRVRKAEVDRRVRRAAAVLGLEDVLRKRPRTLSGGQRQRAAMGRAIVREPQVFLMDEPLSNLDARLRGDMRAEIARIQRDVGVTTLYVTHDQMEAMTLGDRVVVLRDGLLQQVGTPSALYDRPASLFVAGFIGSPPMNLVEATLERSGSDVAVRFGSHRLALDAGAFGAAAAWLGDASRRQAIVGIRPEHLQDAALVPDAPEDRRIRAVVDRRELLGPEVYLRFIVDAPLLLVRDPREQDDPDDVLAAWAAERANAFTARVDPRTAAREGDAVELAVDTERVHLFDPESGTALR